MYLLTAFSHLTFADLHLLKNTSNITVLPITTVQSSGPFVIKPKKYISPLTSKVFLYEIGKTVNSVYAVIAFEETMHVHVISPLCCGFIPRI